MASRTLEKALALIIVFFMVSSAVVLVIKHGNWRNASPSSTTRLEQIEQTIAGYLREFPAKSEIREKTIGILKEYLGKSSVILQRSIHVSAGSSSRVELTLHKDIIYELTVSVSGCFIGSCDIGLELLDSNYRVAFVNTFTGSVLIAGRYSFLRVNFTLNSLIEEDGVFYLELDNSYSIVTSKDIYITLRAYYPSDAFDDEYFKVFAIGHWVSTNIRYISDPLTENEYIAPPNETLNVGAGDCDDYAVLLATLYRSVGLNAVVGLIDTNGDNKVDHATALVYFTGNATEILNGISKWASVLGIEVEKISYFKADGEVYLVVDPPMSTYKNNPWSIYHTPYGLVKVIKP